MASSTVSIAVLVRSACSHSIWISCHLVSCFWYGDWSESIGIFVLFMYLKQYYFYNKVVELWHFRSCTNKIFLCLEYRQHSGESSNCSYKTRQSPVFIFSVIIHSKLVSIWPINFEKCMVVLRLCTYIYHIQQLQWGIEFEIWPATLKSISVALSVKRTQNTDWFLWWQYVMGFVDWLND